MSKYYYKVPDNLLHVPYNENNKHALYYSAYSQYKKEKDEQYYEAPNSFDWNALFDPNKMTHEFEVNPESFESHYKSYRFNTWRRYGNGNANNIISILSLFPSCIESSQNSACIISLVRKKDFTIKESHFSWWENFNQMSFEEFCSNVVFY